MGGVRGNIAGCFDAGRVQGVRGEFDAFGAAGERAAAALFCHRHTLRYRIRRIEQLTGRDFSSARDRIEFWLALRGRELAR